MQAMAGAVSALVSRAGGESRLETRVSPANLCDPVEPGAQRPAGTERQCVLLGSGATVRHSGQRLGGESTGVSYPVLPRPRAQGARRPPTAAQTRHQRIFKKTARIQRRLCAVIPFNKSVSKHYCGGWMKSFILLLHMYFWVDIIHSPQRSQ